MTLPERVAELVEKHGSVRAAARVLQIDAGYLCRLGTGEKTQPSKMILKRMGLRRIDVYELTEAPK